MNRKLKPTKSTLKAPKARPVTIRVAEDDIARAREQADHLGLRYQTYLKSLLHQALVAGASRISQ